MYAFDVNGCYREWYKIVLKEKQTETVQISAKLKKNEKIIGDNGMHLNRLFVILVHMNITYMVHILP